ncbi:MAG TPA: Ig-like domain-containing protein [Conexibacter sp.]|nr:Ig-like domain-containing protein [Conexibacter sp.]
MRQALRSWTVHWRAIVAAVLALGVVLAIAALAWAAPSVSIDSGPSGPTNDAMPVFGFTVDASATTVECSIDQGTPAYGPCSGAATDQPAAPLPDGAYVFRVRATDDQLEQTEMTQSFTVDTTAPSLSVDSGPSRATNDATPSFGFTAEAGATVECSVDQGRPAYGSCTTAISHTVAGPLADGSYVFRVRATDAAGNQAVLTRSFSVDTTAPSLSVDSGPSGLTNDATPSFGFTAEVGATVECSVDQGSAAYGPCTSGATEVVGAPLADGSYVFRVRATDAAGNETVLTQSFTVDTVAPVVGVTSGPAGPTNDTTPSFGFTAEVGATVECSVDQGTPVYGPCSTAVSDTVGAPLADGAYVFRVRATDAAGNQAVATQSFSVDTAAPSLSIDSGPAGLTNDATPSFGFTAEAGATVECSVDQGSPAYGPCTSATTNVVASALPDGTYTFRVRATSGVGNHAVDSRTFTVDTAPPALSVDFGPSGTTSDNTPLFGFSAEAGATVECSIDQGTPAYRPCASATTDAAFAPLADGAYVFRVRATDAAGNAVVLTRSFTVDTAPPTPAPPSPTPNPTPPTTPPVTPKPSGPQLLSPFPLVRISGTLTSTGARIRLLSVRAPRGALVRVAITPACSRKARSSRRCRVVRAAATVGRSDGVAFRSLARTYRTGTVIVVRVWRSDRIGKYTRFTIVRGRAPVRVDQCLLPAATRGSRCPSE